MVELVNAADSKSAGGNTLRVQVSLPVPERTGLWHTTDPSFFSGQPRFPSPAKKTDIPRALLPMAAPLARMPLLPASPTEHPAVRRSQTRRPPCTPKGREYDSRPFLIRLSSHPSMRHDSPRAPVCVPPPDGTRARSPCFALPAASRASPGQSTREDTRARPRRIS